MRTVIARGLTLLCCILPLFAQSNAGELRVRITDPAGLGVQGSIELISEANEFRHTFVTESSGELRIRPLPFGIYQVRVNRPGFDLFIGSQEIRSTIPVEYHIRLDLASLNTAVAVNDQATLVDPHRTGTINRIDSEAIEHRAASLPGRALVDLVDTEPGWLYEGNSVLHPRGSEYQTQFVVDGVPLTDNRSPSFGPQIEAEDVQSLSVYTANFPAEYGRKLGGVVEVVTSDDPRQGWHGKVAGSGGSFSTGDAYTELQHSWKKNTLGFSADGAATGWYLNPPVLQNYTNKGTTSDFSVRYERDLTDNDRLGMIVRREQSGFEVPNEMVQQQAGQRQDRNNRETMGILSYQHIFSTNALGEFHGMMRDDSDGLWSNQLAIPVIATQDRGFREGYAKATVALHHDVEDWKAGVETDFVSVHEAFGDRITDLTRYDLGTPASFAFAGRGHDLEQAAFIQDNIRLGKWSLSAGLRWDHYQFLVNRNAASPRLGIGRYWRAARMVVHASYDHVFQTPTFENLLLSSSPQITALNPRTLRLPVQPSYGNYYEAGISEGLPGKLRLDLNYYRRYLNNYADDDQLLNTSVSFPIGFRKARIYGAEAKLDLPGWNRLSGFASYSYQIGAAYLPVTGGLFLGDDATQALSHLGGRFWDSQDQRHTLQTRYRYQLIRRAWVGFGAGYGSGLPVEFTGTVEDALAQYGPQIVARLDLSRGRLRPSFASEAAAGGDLWKSDRLNIRLQGDVQNLNDRLNLIDFAGLFSGNAVAPPRSFTVTLTTEF